MPIHSSTVHIDRAMLTGVAGQNIPPAGIYPGLKRPSLDYARVYYGLGQFIPRGINLYPGYELANSYLLRPKYTLMISNTISIVMSDIGPTHDLFNFSTSY